MGRSRKSSDHENTILAIVLLLIFAMPIYGIYMLYKGDEEDKGCAITLTVVGGFIWLILAIVRFLD